jgi:magnesium-transporting ATPase (P-type)
VVGSFAAFQQELEVHPSEGYTEHRLALQEVARLYQASVDLGNLHASQGLSSSEAKRRLQKNGPNVLTPPARTPNWLKFARQFKNLFMVLLLAAGKAVYTMFSQLHGPSSLLIPVRSQPGCPWSCSRSNRT